MDKKYGGNRNGSQAGNIVGFILTLIAAAIFYHQVVKNYPATLIDLEASRSVMKEGVFEVTCGRALCNSNCQMAFFCFPLRQAMNFHVTGTGEYWPMLFASMCCPPCVTVYGILNTDMDEKLGG